MALPFIENVGQYDPEVAFATPLFGGTAFITRDGRIVYSFPAPRCERVKPQRATLASFLLGANLIKPGLKEGATSDRDKSDRGLVLTETLVGAKLNPRGGEPSPTIVSLFLGTNPSRWHNRVRTWKSVSLGEVYPGITLELRAHAGSVEKVFTVASAADVRAIALRVTGADTLRTEDGSLMVETGAGGVRLSSPVAYQNSLGKKIPVAAAYGLLGQSLYGFTLASHDRGLAVVIDPIVQSIYVMPSVGDSYDPDIWALTIDPGTGDVYVAGDVQAVKPKPNGDFTVAGFWSRGTAGLRGKAGGSFGCGLFPQQYTSVTTMAIHPATGALYIGGFGTGCLDMDGGPNSAIPANPNRQAPYGYTGFVLRVSPDTGAIDAATFFGGSEDTYVSSIAIGASTGGVYVAGRTGGELPGTAGGAQPQPSFVGCNQIFGGCFNPFVTRLDQNLSTIVQTTFFSPSDEQAAKALAIHPTTGEVYVGGDGKSSGSFVAGFSPDLRTVRHSAHLSDSTGVIGLAVDLKSGDLFFATSSSLRRLDQALAVLKQASAGIPQTTAMAFDSTVDQVFLAGTSGPGLDASVDAIQTQARGPANGFVIGLASDLSMVLGSTYLGGSGTDVLNAIAIHPATGNVYVAGSTSSTDFPGVYGGFPSQQGGYVSFVACLTPDLRAQPTPTLTPTPPVTSTPTPTPTPPSPGFCTSPTGVCWAVPGVFGITCDPPNVFSTTPCSTPTPTHEVRRHLSRSGP